MLRTHFSKIDYIHIEKYVTEIGKNDNNGASVRTGVQNASDLCVCLSYQKMLFENKIFGLAYPSVVYFVMRFPTNENDTGTFVCELLGPITIMHIQQRLRCAVHLNSIWCAALVYTVHTKTDSDVE